MRPLVAPEEARIGGTGAPRREFFRLPRRVWLTTAISAAACLTVIGLIAALSNQGTQQSVETAVYIGDSLPHVPAFFVDAGSTGIYHQKLRVISLTTGKVTSTEHAPAGTSDISFLAEQPQTGKYVAGFIGSRRGVALYRFRITGTGQLTKLMPAGRILPKEQPENVTPLALSPDGSHLAVSEVANGVPAPKGRFDAKIIVLDLRNGTRQVPGTHHESGRRLGDRGSGRPRRQVHPRSR